MYPAKSTARTRRPSPSGYIGSQLKTYFEHDQAQPVSDRLARLLREVKSRDDAAAQEVCPQEPDTP